MAIIPLNQTVTVHKAAKEGELDKWGNPITPEPMTLQCRVDEGSYITTDAGSSKQGAEVVAEAKVLFDAIASIHYADEVEYENELGETIKRRPKRISVKRGMSGEPMLTEVML